MSLGERAAIILPIMKKKARVLELNMEFLTSLENCIDVEFPGFMKHAQPRTPQAKASLKVFREVLKSRNMNSFVKLLTDGVEVSHELQVALGAVEAQMRPC
jgi:hypothetical protein